MSTHLGAGASQSLEVRHQKQIDLSLFHIYLRDIQDAYILGRILTHPAVHLGNVHEALQVYQKVRLPIANAAVERSRTTGLIYEFNYPAAFGCHDEDTSEADMTERFIDAVYGQWTWQWEGLPTEDWAKAEELLITALGYSPLDIPVVKSVHLGLLDEIAKSPKPQLVA